MDDFRGRRFQAPRRRRARRESPYPVVQWHNERNGLPGAFELPIRYFEDLDLFEDGLLPDAEVAGLKLVSVHHVDGVEPAYLYEKDFLAIVGWRPLRWFQGAPGGCEWAPAGLAEPWRYGYRSKRQALCVSARLWKAGHGGFVVVTTTGLASRDFGRGLKALFDFLRRAEEALGEAAGRGLPSYAFWLPFEAGGTTRTRMGAPITALVHGVPKRPAEEDFQRLLIGEGVQSFIEAHLAEAEAWEDVNGNGAAANGGWAEGNGRG